METPSEVARGNNEDDDDVPLSDARASAAASSSAADASPAPAQHAVDQREAVVARSPGVTVGTSGAPSPNLSGGVNV